MSAAIITDEERAAAIAQRPAASARELQLMATVGEYRTRIESLLGEIERLRLAQPGSQVPGAVMNADQRRITLHAMSRFGGRFVSRLAEAWSAAEPLDSIKLGALFAGYVALYGPGSADYAEAERRELA
jgi:hypothetical protein